MEPHTPSGRNAHPVTQLLCTVEKLSLGADMKVAFTAHSRYSQGITLHQGVAVVESFAIFGMQLRKLLATFKKKRQEGDKDPELLVKLRNEHFPNLPEVNASMDAADIKDKLRVLAEKRQQLQGLKRKLQAVKEGRKLSEVSVIEDDDE